MLQIEITLSSFQYSGLCEVEVALTILKLTAGQTDRQDQAVIQCEVS